MLTDIAARKSNDCRFRCSIVNWTGTLLFPSLCFLLRWRLQLLNGWIPTLLLLLLTYWGGESWTSSLSDRSSSCRTPFHPPTMIYVATGQLIPHSIPRFSYWGACFSWMRTGTIRCLTYSTQLVTIYLWWNTVSYLALDQRPTFSRTRASTRLRIVYLRLTIPCESRGWRGPGHQVWKW